MKNIFLFLLLFLFINSYSGYAQITNFNEKFELPAEVKETSGLLFFNGKIITHNDSGDDANLYEIDSLTGNLIRTISINNVTNVDWEDITEDENYIYIADIGNNNGNRTDLKILRILKSDYINNDSVSADTISFSYEDQNDFTSKPNANNFDAESLVFSNNSLFVFTKNWTDFKTNVYKIPTTIGNHSAIKISSANVEGLITGATLHNGNYILCGYNTSAVPFLIYISSSNIFGDDIFDAGFNKYSLNNEIEQFSQIEAITSFNNGKFYLSREKVDSNGINLPQKLYEFEDDRTKTLTTNNKELESFKISPNPTSGKFFVNSKIDLSSITVFNTLGKEIFSSKINQKKIDISEFPKGIYLLRIFFENNTSIIRKIIKL